jgi:hypothetical protein
MGFGAHFGTAHGLFILAAVASLRPVVLIGILALVCVTQVIREVVGQFQAD